MSNSPRHARQRPGRPTSPRPRNLPIGAGAFAVALLLVVPSLVGDGQKPGIVQPLTEAAVRRMDSDANASRHEAPIPEATESTTAESADRETADWWKPSDNSMDVGADAATGQAASDSDAPEAATAQPAIDSADASVDVGPIHK